MLVCSATTGREDSDRVQAQDVGQIKQHKDMKTRKAGIAGVTVMVLLGFTALASADVPADFPQFTLLPNTDPAPGCLIGSLTATGVTGYSSYFAILDSTGNAVLTSKTDSLGELACNGLFVSLQGTKGVDVNYQCKNSAFVPVGNSVVAGNGYIADNHDFRVLPNGHSLVMIYDSQYVDMSKIVAGGYPAARIDESVIQEVDIDNNVVFQWRSFDHIPITDTYKPITKNLDYIHVNSIWFDELDGNIIASCRETSEVIKINRTTGDLVWRMGGKHNEFTFINGIPGNTDPPMFQEQHSARRLANGNLTIFDNGYAPNVPGMDRPYSRAVEYVIDEVNKTATLVWQFRHNPDIITSNGGSMKRLAGGHSIIQWGPDNTASPKLAMTEVDEAGNLVRDMALLQTGVTGNFTVVDWPVTTNDVTVMREELRVDNQFVFTQGTKVTGVTVDVLTLEGDGYNTATVTRQPFAPVLPRFEGRAPRVLPVRVNLTQTAITDMTALMSFDVAGFGITDPAHTKVYYRPTPGQGLFIELETEYNNVTGKLQAGMFGFGEFILGFPDQPAVAYPPLLVTPKAEAEVNQSLPVSLFWTPKGFADSYQLQVATDAEFNSLVLNVSGLKQSRYTIPSVSPGTRYYWRVNTTNEGGTGAWTSQSFTTVPPMVQVTVPNGGESVRRGLSYVIQWNANIAETVAIELYKAGVLVKTITSSAPNIGAYTWTAVTTSLVPGSDYTIKVRSSTNPALFDVSAATFSIDVPYINPGSLVRLSDGRVQFGLTAPGATQAKVQGSVNLTDWGDLQTVPVTNGAATFTDETAPSFPKRFYRLYVAP